MPTERIAMRRVREMLRLRLDAELSVQEVARRTGVARSTLREMLQRFAASGLAWPLPLDLTDKDLELRLYGEAGTKQGYRRRAEPDWAALNRELKQKHVTLQILWDEYIEAHPDGYRYSRFCELYRSWEARLPVTMRQTHLGGDKLFVDYAGDTVPVIIDRRGGKTQPAHIFVAVMGASSLTFACATWSEKLPDWVDGHVQAFAFFGGARRRFRARRPAPGAPRRRCRRAGRNAPAATRPGHRTHSAAPVVGTAPAHPAEGSAAPCCARIRTPGPVAWRPNQARAAEPSPPLRPAAASPRSASLQHAKQTEPFSDSPSVPPRQAEGVSSSSPQGVNFSGRLTATTALSSTSVSPSSSTSSPLRMATAASGAASRAWPPCNC